MVPATHYSAMEIEKKLRVRRVKSLTSLSRKKSAGPADERSLRTERDFADFDSESGQPAEEAEQEDLWLEEQYVGEEGWMLEDGEAPNDEMLFIGGGRQPSHEITEQSHDHDQYQQLVTAQNAMALRPTEREDDDTISTVKSGERSQQLSVGHTLFTHDTDDLHAQDMHNIRDVRATARSRQLRRRSANCFRTRGTGLSCGSTARRKRRSWLVWCPACCSAESSARWKTSLPT